LYIVIWG